MKFVLLIAIILSLNSATFAKKKKGDPYKNYLAKVRCSRRYSVGNCPDSVVPVWTYVPHLQNCTERLGCASATISNRFATLAICMHKCRMLRNMYTMLLTETNLTNSGLRSAWVSVDRRDYGMPDAEADYDAAPDYPERPREPAAEFHTEAATPREDYDDVPPEVEFWNGK